MEKIIYEKPVYEVIDSINSKNSDSILLVGNRGSGKSTIVDYYLKNNSDFAINCTINAEEVLKIEDYNMHKLYYICLLIKKIMAFIEEKHPFCLYYFKDYKTSINIILFHIQDMYMINDYRQKDDSIGLDLCLQPELLLDDFCNRLKKSMDYNSLKVIIDDFDAYDDFNGYQLMMYNLLKKRLNTIYVTSDKEILGNTEKRNILQRNNDIVDVNYSSDIFYVKSILDILTMKYNISGKLINLNDRALFLLDDEIVELLINITDGNIREMYNIVSKLYQYKDSLKKEEYQKFIVEYYKDRMDFLSSNIEIKRERKLNI